MIEYVHDKENILKIDMNIPLHMRFLLLEMLLFWYDMLQI